MERVSVLTSMGLFTWREEDPETEGNIQEWGLRFSSQNPLGHFGDSRQHLDYILSKCVCGGGGAAVLGGGGPWGSGGGSATPICSPRHAYASWPNQSLSFDNNQKPIISAWEFLGPTAQRLVADSLFKIHDYSIVSFHRCRTVPTSCKTIRACDRLEMRQMSLSQLARVACLEIFSRQRDFLF